MQKPFLLSLALILVQNSWGLCSQPLEKNSVWDWIQSPTRGTDAIPFAQFKAADFIPALDRAAQAAEARRDAILTNSEPASFENTILPLEQISKELDDVYIVIYALWGTVKTPEIEAARKHALKLIVPFESSVFQNAKLAERVKQAQVNIATHTPDLARSEDVKLLIQQQIKSFEDNLVYLDGEKKARATVIQQELSDLSAKFSDNLTEYMAAHPVVFTDEADLDGVPETTIRSARTEEAAGSGRFVYRFEIGSDALSEVSAHAVRESTRRKIFEHTRVLAGEGEKNNFPVAQKVLALHEELALLTGRKNYATWALEDAYLKSPERVLGFLDSLARIGRPRAEEELKAVSIMKLNDVGNDELKPWDLGYYMRRYLKEHFGIDPEFEKEYLALDRVLRDGVFYVFERLYNLQILDRKDLQGWDADVRVYDVVQNGALIGRIYYDPYLRKGRKKSGAWALPMKKANPGAFDAPSVAQVQVVTNFDKSNLAERPDLINFGSVTTLFHEFGHVFHGIFSKARFESQAGTAVPRDFVELPSQIMENFAWIPEVISRYARHYKTGEILSPEYLKKKEASQSFGNGSMMLRKAGMSRLDITYYTTPVSEIGDLREFEIRQMEAFSFMPPELRNLWTTRFHHIFSGGYKSKYYGYAWCDILEATAFEEFQKVRYFDRDTAQRFQKLLSYGASRNPETNFLEFMLGQEPRLESFLEREGLLGARPWPMPVVAPAKP